jgi:hypothetical protein
VIRAHPTQKSEVRFVKYEVVIDQLIDLVLSSQLKPVDPVNRSEKISWSEETKDLADVVRGDPLGAVAGRCPAKLSKNARYKGV